MEPEMITITLDEYNSLKRDAKLLACLENAGVDIWDGYDFAMEEFNEEGED